MKFRTAICVLFVLLCSICYTSHTIAAPGHRDRVWRNGEWGWRSYHHASFANRYYWRYRGNRVGMHEAPGRFYRPWLPKRREFHNSGDDFSHRYYR